MKPKVAKSNNNAFLYVIKSLCFEKSLKNIYQKMKLICFYNGLDNK